MGNILRILKRDIVRLLKAPAAMVVVLALIVLPSAYTWYNVAGFWNPYDNTGQLRVDVVNQDAGASSQLTGDMNIGDQVVEALRQNSQLNWQFTDFETAMHELSSGQSYAAFVIPEDFTANLLTITTGSFVKPDIQYYVNEKTGPVAPKITDAGASTLDETINSTFVSTASEVAAEAIDAAIGDIEQDLNSVRTQASQKLAEGISACQEAQASLSEMERAANGAALRTPRALQALDNASAQIAIAKESLGEMARIAKELQDAASKLLEASSLADAIGGLTNTISPSGGNSEGESAYANTNDPAGTASPDQFTGQKAASDIANQLGSIYSTSSTLEGEISSQELLVEQARSLLMRQRAILESTSGALSETSALIDNLERSLSTAQTDIAALEASTALTSIFGSDKLNPQTFADFMGSPAKLETEPLYKLNAYGAAMAPLFMNLTFWIGAFMLVVILRQEVDSEGIRNLTLAQRYLGRFLLMAILVVLQAIVCSAGVLLMGVEATSGAGLIFASAWTSLSYLSIIYALSITLQHIGKGICIILVFAQIPGATGLYPIEMTSSFFQTIYPLFPFTYGIDAMRESIGGFYGSNYAVDLAVLALFFVIFMAFGLLVRPLLANVNRMTARQIRASGIYNGENVEIPMRRYRLSQIVRAMTEREEYRAQLERRYDHYRQLYPKVMRWLIALGLGVPVVIGVVFAITPAEKVIALTLWLAWFIALIVIVVILESLKYSIERQLRLDNMSEGELQDVYESRNRVGDEAAGGARVESECYGYSGAGTAADAAERQTKAASVASPGGDAQ